MTLNSLLFAYAGYGGEDDELKFEMNGNVTAIHKEEQEISFIMDHSRGMYYKAYK